MTYSILHDQVLSQKTHSTFRNTASVGLFYFRGRSSVKEFSLFNMSHYSTLSGDEFASSSKRRSRGPVMAAKKAAEGVFLCYHSFSRKRKTVWKMVLIVLLLKDILIFWLLGCLLLLRSKARRWKIQAHSWSAKDIIWHESKFFNTRAWTSKNMGGQPSVQEGC